MHHYLLYHIKQHQFVGVDKFDAEDDAHALRDANSFNGTATSELWEGDRKITTLQQAEAA